jgi:hypothetical protein
MTIIEFTEKLQNQMKEQADLIKSSQLEGVTLAARMVPIVQELMHDLQQFSYNYTFSDQQEEIKFFKESKPVLLSHYYYYRKEFAISLYDSFKDIGTKRRYYESVLNHLGQYARKNNEFYLYCMTGQTYLDDKYFSRNGASYRGLIDVKFSTGFDTRLARLLANELIKENILERISGLDRNTERQRHVHWTGKKSDAIELLFALQASGSINNGEVEVKKLVSTFEELFNIQFGNYYDFVKKIRMRKSGQAKFLDMLKAKFLLRLDQMDE